MIIESMVTYQALDDESDIHVHIPIIYPGSLEKFGIAEGNRQHLNCNKYEIPPENKKPIKYVIK